MEIHVRVRLAVYRFFAEAGRAPAIGEIAARAGASETEVLAAYRELQVRRLLVLEEDAARIRMAPPFSGVPTPHVVEADGRSWFANCAWDALGIPAALRRPALVRSRCAQSGEALVMEVGVAGPPASDWLFHSLVPAARWWEDIVFT